MAGNYKYAGKQTTVSDIVAARARNTVNEWIVLVGNINVECDAHCVLSESRQKLYGTKQLC